MSGDKKPEMGVVEVPKGALLAKFGEKYSVDQEKVYSTLCKTAFKDATSVEQVVALLVVADQYGLNPFTREIYAFPDKDGGVVPVVGVDGWNRIAQQHDQYDGIEFNYSDDIVIPDGDGKECPTWVEVVIYRKDRSHPVVLREYLDECYKPLGKYPDGNKHKAGPWQTHTKRMLRHKAIIQGYRTAFGFHGIYDPDEAANFIDVEGGTIQGGDNPPPTDGRKTRTGSQAINTALGTQPAQEPAAPQGADASSKGIDKKPALEEEDDGLGI